MSVLQRYSVVKCLLGKHEGPESGFPVPMYKPNLVANICNFSFGRERQMAPKALLDNQTGHNTTLQVP